jgi:hypothetical protein
MTSTGRARRDGVLVEVAAGGALRLLELDPQVVGLGGRKLADTILALVREANAKATRKAAAAIRQQHPELSERELAALGLAGHGNAGEMADNATRESWMRNG